MQAWILSQPTKSGASLFRAEAIATTAEQRFGRVFVHQPWGYGIAVVIAQSPCPGPVGTRAAASAGLFAEVRVKEGFSLEIGDALCSPLYLAYKPIRFVSLS